AFVGRIAGEGDARTVGRPARREGNRMKTGELVLISAVIIHDPDFLVPVAGGANESDLCGTDARRAAGKFADNFVSKVVGVLADLQVGGSAAIDLADDRRRRGIAQVKKPGLDGDLGRGLGQIAKADVAGVGGLLDPSRSFQLRWDRGRSRRVEAGAGELDDAADLQVITDDVGEEGSMRFSRGRARTK